MEENIASAPAAEKAAPRPRLEKNWLKALLVPKKYKFRIIKHEIDKPFLLLILVLLVFGIIMMFSASYARAISDMGDGFYYLKRQVRWALLGLVVMVVVSMMDYHLLANTVVTYFAFGVTWALSVITIFVGTSTADATRWLDFGPIQVQPSELLKIGFIILFAYIGSTLYPYFIKWQASIFPFAIVFALVMIVLVAQRHMSAVMIIAIIGVVMMYISGMPKRHFWGFMMFAVLMGGVLVAYMISAGNFGYITDRIESWRDPLSDPRDKTLQTYNSLIAIGSGGVFGLGFGESRQKYMYLPESQNDFVFSVVCEELGLVGALTVIMLFVMFILRGFYIASRCKDRFGMLLSAGITMQIGTQAFLNIAVASNAFPNTGISLPFFSYGGSSLLITLAEVGLLLSISRQSATSK